MKTVKAKIKETGKIVEGFIFDNNFFVATEFDDNVFERFYFDEIEIQGEPSDTIGKSDLAAAADKANYNESHSLNAFIAFDEGFKKGAEWQRKQFDVKLPLIQKSWYEEGKIAGKYEGLTDDEKYQQGLHDGKEELMKKAVIARSGDLDWTAEEVREKGEKVRVIIIKEDKEDEE